MANAIIHGDGNGSEKMKKKKLTLDVVIAKSEV